METVRKFIEIAAKELGWGSENNGIGIIWKGEGLKEIGIRADNGQVAIRIDPRYFRPAEVEELLGDPSKAKIKLGWEPKITLEELIRDMIKNDLLLSKNDMQIKLNRF